MMPAAGTLRELAVGVIPFLLGDLIKVFLALLILERLHSTSLGRI